MFPPVQSLKTHRVSFKQPLLLVEGHVTRRDGTLSVVAERLTPLGPPAAGASPASFAAPRAKNWG